MELIEGMRQSGQLLIPDELSIPLNKYQKATYREGSNQTFLSAVNMLNQVVIKFAGNKAGSFSLPETEVASPKVRVFLGDMQPILDGNLISGMLTITEYNPGEYIKGNFKGKEKIAGHNIYIDVQGEFFMPSVLRL